MPTLAERLKGQWVLKGVPVRTGVRQDEITTFESSHGVSLPPDLRNYFTTVDGMERGESDEDMLEFLHLGAVKSVPEELPDWRGIPDYGNILDTLANAERYFVIADFMLSSHVYAIRLSADASEETPVILISGDHYWQVAASFSEFAEKYLEGGAWAVQ